MKKRIMIAALAVAAVFALSACKQDEQPDDTVTPETQIKISKLRQMTGQTMKNKI